MPSSHRVWCHCVSVLDIDCAIVLPLGPCGNHAETPKISPVISATESSGRLSVDPFSLGVHDSESDSDLLSDDEDSPGGDEEDGMLSSTDEEEHEDADLGSSLEGHESMGGTQNVLNRQVLDRFNQQHPKRGPPPPGSHIHEIGGYVSMSDPFASPPARSSSEGVRDRHPRDVSDLFGVVHKRVC